MKTAKYVGKPISLDKMEKVGFVEDDICDFGPDPLYRFELARKPNGEVDDGEKDYECYLLLVRADAGRISYVTLAWVWSIYEVAWEPRRCMEPALEKKAERLLKRILIPESQAEPPVIEAMGDFFVAASRVMESARKGRRLLFRSGPFIFVACKDGNCWDAWALSPIKRRSLYLMAERGGWPSNVEWDTERINFRWDGTYGIGGIAVKGDDCILSVDVTLNFNGKRRYIGSGKSFTDRFIKLEDEIDKEHLPKRKKAAKR